MSGSIDLEAISKPIVQNFGLFSVSKVNVMFHKLVFNCKRSLKLVKAKYDAVSLVFVPSTHQIHASFRLTWACALIELTVQS